MPDMQNQYTESHSPKKVVVIGAGGHGRVIADIVTLSGDVVLGFLDDKDPSEFPNITILGKLADIDRFEHEALFIVGIGNNQSKHWKHCIFQSMAFGIMINPTIRMTWFSGDPIMEST
jgi:hypothetical protein